MIPAYSVSWEVLCLLDTYITTYVIINKVHCIFTQLEARALERPRAQDDLKIGR